MLGLFYFYNMNLKTLYNIFLGNQSICTDTRKLKKNDIYFALKGENFDGNKLINICYSSKKRFKLKKRWAFTEVFQVLNFDKIQM